MARIQETTGSNAILNYSIDGGTTWTPFASIEEVTSGPKITAKEISTTKLASDAETSQPSIPDYGEVGYVLMLQPEIVGTITGFMQARQLINLKIEIADKADYSPAFTYNSTATFPGWVKEFELFDALKKDDKAKHKITVKVTGKIVFKAANNVS